MPKTHIVRLGDCIESIALRYGFFPNTIWLDDANAALREKRTDPHVLEPGDEVIVPDKAPKSVAVATGKKWTFRRNGVPAKFRTVLEKDGEPRADVSYRLTVGAREYEGTTGADGLIEHWIDPDAKLAELFVDGTAISIRLGELRPVSEDEGVFARLENLGYIVFPEDPPSVRATVRLFQKSEGLPVTGELDEATRERLRVVHRS